MALGDLEAKWRSFGWAAMSVDGHSFDHLMAAFAHAGETRGKPLLLLQHRERQGHSFMEGRPEWHNRMPSESQIAVARAELGLENTGT